MAGGDINHTHTTRGERLRVYGKDIMSTPYIDRETGLRVLEALGSVFHGDLLQGPVYGPHAAFIQQFIYAAGVDYLFNEHPDPYAVLDGFDAGVDHAVWELIYDAAPESTQRALIAEGWLLGIAHDRGLCVLDNALDTAISAIRMAMERVVGVDPANGDVELAEDCMPKEHWDAAYAAAQEAAPRVPEDAMSQIRDRLSEWELDPGSVAVSKILTELRRIID